MIRTLLIAGLLLVGTTTKAQAACPESDVAYMLSRLTPVGHYTTRVVRRIDDGILNAREAPESTEEKFAELFTDELTKMTSTYYGFIDTDLRSVEHSKDLTDINACLHIDLAILEAKLEQIRCEMNTAYERRSRTGIKMLREVADFTNERIHHLVNGSHDPQYEDTNWENYNSFDDTYEGWCCDRDSEMCSVQDAIDCPTGLFFTRQDACVSSSVCKTAEEEPDDMVKRYTVQCPFDSDYLAPNTSGYGCDLSVLNNIPLPEDSSASTTKETTVLRHVYEARNAYIQDMQHLKNITLKTDTIADNAILNTNERQDLARFGQSIVSSDKHRRVWGCFADLTPEERELLPPMTDAEANRGTFGRLTPLLRPSQEWVTIPTRSAFFFRKDHIGIWKVFLGLNHGYVLMRDFPSYLKKPEEFFRKEDREEAIEAENESKGLLRGVKEDGRSGLIDFMLRQATQEAAVLPKVHDTPLQIRDALSPVRAAMKKNVELVHKPNVGLRKFARNYAYFLRRSCIYRPCNTKLETIVKILYTEECFPYASGLFKAEPKEGEEDNPIWQTCIQEMNKL